MGEVRVKARLTNAVDEALVRRGMLGAEQVRICEADALVDTGAVRVVVPAQVASRLGLGIRGRRVAEDADGRKETVDVTGPLVVELEGRDTLEEALVLGDEVLIGQTSAGEARPVRRLPAPASRAESRPSRPAGHEDQVARKGRNSFRKAVLAGLASSSVVLIFQELGQPLSSG